MENMYNINNLTISDIANVIIALATLFMVAIALKALKTWRIQEENKRSVEIIAVSYDLRDMLAHARRRENFNGEEGDLTMDLHSARSWLTENSGKVVSRGYELKIIAKYFLKSKDAEKNLDRIFEIIREVTHAANTLATYIEERGEIGASVPLGVRELLEEIIWCEGGSDRITREANLLVEDLESKLSKFISR